MGKLYCSCKERFLPGGQALRKSPLREIFSLAEAQQCFCLSCAQGKNREPGSRDFSVRKNTCDDGNGSGVSVRQKRANFFARDRNRRPDHVPRSGDSEAAISY